MARQQRVRVGREALIGDGRRRVEMAVLLQPLGQRYLGIVIGRDRPGLTSAPPGTDPETRDLPVEWLASSAFAWDESPFSVAAGAGSSLPLSSAPSANGTSVSFSGVTAPAFRAVVALRFTPQAAVS